MNSYLENYVERIKQQGNITLAEAIKKTVNDLVPKYISGFSYSEHIVGLLLGDVQSGKTSHMFGIMSAAADEGFSIFVLLTTDITLLQQQTLKRACSDLSDFCICGEDDYIKFIENRMKPIVIILKKNGKILKKWKNGFSSSKLVCGNPLFIVDDEADAASLNTKVNINKQSTINKCLEDIKRISSSSIYLEVTGTPQSILLQSKRSGWKPCFTYYFKPGNGYLGGNFFFTGENNQSIILTDDEEAVDILDDDEFPENGLKTALITHFITSAYIKLQGGNVCNFLIHPSLKTSQHDLFSKKIGAYINELYNSYDEPETKSSVLCVYKNLRQTKRDIFDFETIYHVMIKIIRNGDFNILVLNSKMSYEENVRYDIGYNIIIGGNSLGRGITFPCLQTIYYCRLSKKPQADTMWQHARMFGYDRDSALIRVFMPPKLFKLFSDINATNNSIINQIEKLNNICDIKIIYPKDIQPTRKNVLDKKAIRIFSGGVNYFPFYPVNTNLSVLDQMLSSFEDGEYSVSLKFIVKILSYIESEEDDWESNLFRGFINAFVAENPLSQGTLIIRRNRDIGRGTGTLLSPNDRVLGDVINDRVVLTLYKVTGTKGWNGEQIWIPNIKLPGSDIYYSGDSFL